MLALPKSTVMESMEHTDGGSAWLADGRLATRQAEGQQMRDAVMSGAMDR